MKVYGQQGHEQSHKLGVGFKGLGFRAQSRVMCESAYFQTYQTRSEDCEAVEELPSEAGYCEQFSAAGPMQTKAGDKLLR